MNIAVIGAGTAGIMSLCHALKWLCLEDSTITSIYSPNIKPLPVGETMDPGFITSLFDATGFTFLEDGHELDATIKLGVLWKNWRPKDFIINMKPPEYSISFNAGKLKEFCFKRFKERYPDNFKILEGEVEKLTSNHGEALIVVDGIEHHFDWVIDCRGYPTDFTDYHMMDIPVNHVLVNVIKEPAISTTPQVQAHKNGWMFYVPLTTRQAWGYLYNDNITSKEEAVNNIKELFNTDEVNLNEFTFKSYYAKQFFDGRILKNGNTALFLEPIEGLAGFFYQMVMRCFTDYVKGVATIDDVNGRLKEYAQYNELFINYAYHGGSVYDTEFWRITKQKCGNRLDELNWNEKIASIKSAIDINGETTHSGLFGWSNYHWKCLDRNFEYNYFKE